MNASGASRIRVLGRVLVASALLLLACSALLAAPATAWAANAYGQTFEGQAACLKCHGNATGRWQVGRYLDTAHAKDIVDAGAAPGSVVPSSGSSAWPSPLFGGGIRFGFADVKWMLGSPGGTHLFISHFNNDATHTLSTGYDVGKVGGPADDWLSFSTEYDESDGWMPQTPTKVSSFFQDCATCHFFGVTRPSNVAYTLASGATMDHSTETSWAGVGIQCESCHGTGRMATSQETTHWTDSTEIVRTHRALESDTCGQCHASMSAQERVYTGYYNFFSTNGFTPDRNLKDFVDFTGSNYVKTSPFFGPPAIPTSDTAFYPSGQYKGANGGLYNEWMISGHARSLRYSDGHFFSPFYQDASCLPCHSGEGFLKSIGYGQDGPNDMGLYTSSLASDTLDIECAVCHTVHAKTGDALGLRLPKTELCATCHTGQSIFGGTGLEGVADAKAFMGNATCADCHMPETRENMPSHRLKVMLPGDAEAWNVRKGGDSCTPCHASKTREDLQGNIGYWQSAITTKIADAQDAIDAAMSRPASKTPEGASLIEAANANVALVQGDGSTGVHNYPYAKAGLDKAAYFARAVGASFPAFALTAFDSYHGVSLAFGRLVMGDGTHLADEVVTIQAKPGGTSTWVPVSSVKTDANGDFAAAVYPTGTTQYRATWMPYDSDSSTYSSVQTITFGSKTTIHLSASRLARGKTVTITGSVSPNHAGKSVTVHYKAGTGSWRTLTTKTLNSSSAYTASMRLGSRGSYYFHVHFGGDPSHTGSVSSTAKVQVY